MKKYNVTLNTKQYQSDAKVHQVLPTLWRAYNASKTASSGEPLFLQIVEAGLDVAGCAFSLCSSYNPRASHKDKVIQVVKAFENAFLLKHPMDCIH